MSQDVKDVKDVKNVKDVKKINSEISATCKHDLEILASLLQTTLHKTIQIVLEKNVSNILHKEINKKLKGTEVLEE